MAAWLYKVLWAPSSTFVAPYEWQLDYTQSSEPPFCIFVAPMNGSLTICSPLNPPLVSLWPLWMVAWLYTVLWAPPSTFVAPMNGSLTIRSPLSRPGSLFSPQIGLHAGGSVGVPCILTIIFHTVHTHTPSSHHETQHKHTTTTSYCLSYTYIVQCTKKRILKMVEIPINGHCLHFLYCLTSYVKKLINTERQTNKLLSSSF